MFSYVYISVVRGFGLGRFLKSLFNAGDRYSTVIRRTDHGDGARYDFLFHGAR